MKNTYNIIILFYLRKIKRRPTMLLVVFRFMDSKNGLFAYSHFLQEVDAVVNVFVHDFVDVDKVDAFAVVGHEVFDEGAALEAFLMTEVECLGCIEELDGEDTLGVFHYAVAFGGSVAAHADEVLLVLAGGDAVDAAG